MSGYGIGLTVLGALLAAYAVRTLAFRREGEEARSLGCGFALVAGLVWGLLLGRVAGLGEGMRLGLGLGCLVGGAAMLFQRKRRFVPAALMGCLALMLVEPSATQVLRRYGSAESRETVRLEEELITLEAQLEVRQKSLKQLEDRQERIRDRLKQEGFRTYEEITANSEAYAGLKQLRQLKAAIATETENVRTLRLRRERQKLAVEHARAVEEAAGNGVDPPPIPPAPPPPETPDAEPSVEDMLERETLREFFEQEF